MDIGDLKKQSDLSYNIAIAKRNALEKAHSRMVLVYSEHIFRADPETICLVRTLKETNDNNIIVRPPRKSPIFENISFIIFVFFN